MLKIDKPKKKKVIQQKDEKKQSFINPKCKKRSFTINILI